MMRSRRIRIFLLGGLGNQLFGTFFGRAISLQSVKQVELSDRMIPFGSNPKRSVVVGEIPGVIGSKVVINQSRLLGIKLLSKSKLLRKVVWKSFELISGKNRISLKEFWNFEFNPSKHIEILDYCDDWFFPEYVREREGRLDIELQRSTRTNSGELDRDSILVHVRIGDYLEHLDTYTLLDENYYLVAINHIRRKANQTLPVVIVCEDANEVLRFYPKLANSSSRIFDRKNTKSDLEAFFLLLEANHLIAANSTFSMWAAWFGLQERESTIVPFDLSLNGNQSGLLELSWSVLDARTGESIGKRPYSSWFSEKKARFHAIISAFDSQPSN